MSAVLAAGRESLIAETTGYRYATEPSACGSRDRRSRARACAKQQRSPEVVPENVLSAELRVSEEQCPRDGTPACHFPSETRGGEFGVLDREEGRRYGGVQISWIPE